MVGGILSGMMANMGVDNEAGQILVLNRVDRVSDNTKNVKTRQDRLSQIHLKIKLNTIVQQNKMYR